MNDIYKGLYKDINKLITDRISKRFQVYLLIAGMKLKDIERYETDNSIKWIHENKVYPNKNPYLITKDTLQIIDDKLLKKLSNYEPFYSTFNFVMGLPADIFRIGYTTLCRYFNNIKEENNQYLYHNKWFMLLNCLFSGNSLLLSNNYFNISKKLKGTKFENRWNAYIKSAKRINTTDFFLDPKKLPFDKEYMMLFSRWGFYFITCVEDYFKNEYQKALNLKKEKHDYEIGVHNAEFNLYKNVGKKFFRALTDSIIFFNFKIVKDTPGYTVWTLAHNLNYTLNNSPNNLDLILSELKEIGHYIAIDSKLNIAKIFQKDFVEATLSYNIDFLLKCSKREAASLISSIDFSELYNKTNKNPKLKIKHQTSDFFKRNLTKKDLKHFKKDDLCLLCSLYNIDTSNLKNKEQLGKALHNYFSNLQ